MEKFEDYARVGILGVLGIAAVNILGVSIAGLVEMKRNKMRGDELDKYVRELNSQIESKKESE